MQGRLPSSVGTPLSQMPPEPRESQHEPGEFTRMFGAPGGRRRPPCPPCLRTVFPSVPHNFCAPFPQEAAKEGPGEFTKQFLVTGLAGQKATPPAPPPTPELKPEPAVKPPDKRPRGQVPSGFEVVYQSRKQSPRAGAPLAPPEPMDVPPPQAPAETSGPGEFTQMFSAMGKGKADQPLPSSPPASAMPPSVAPPPPTPEAEGPGQFTQMFSAMGKGKADQPLPLSSPPAWAPCASSPQPLSEKAGPGEFTQLFQASMGKTPATRGPFLLRGRSPSPWRRLLRQPKNLQLPRLRKANRAVPVSSHNYLAKVALIRGGERGRPVLEARPNRLHLCQAQRKGLAR